MAMAWRDENRRIDFFFILLLLAYLLHQVQVLLGKKSLVLFQTRVYLLSYVFYYYLFLLFRSPFPIDVNGKKS